MLNARQERSMDELAALEKDLPSIVLEWAEGKQPHEVLAEHKMKISERKTLLEDITVGFSVITKAIAHETKIPIAHAIKIMDEIRYLLGKEAAKKPKEAKG